MKKIITILIIAALAAALAISLVACNTGDDGGYTRPDGSFNPEIFSPMRIKVAPAVCFIGFVSIVYAIIRKPKDTGEDTEKETKQQ